MKISNETKIGILAIAAIVLLFLGFSFLRGKSMFHKETKMYAVYRDVLGLKKSNPVVINGLQVGQISDISGGKDMRRLVVTVTFSEDVNIPDNSVAVINPNLLGSPTLEIQLGTASNYKQSGDTLLTMASTGAIDEALKVLNPVLYEVRNAVQSLDSVLHIVSTTFDPTTKNNIKDIIKNLDLVTESFSVSARSLEVMMDPQKGALSQSLHNVNAFTANLRENNEKVDNILSNFNTTSSKLAGIDLTRTVDSLNDAIYSLQNVAARMNSNEGSLGRLLNDQTLYQNLESTTHKLNTLIDDVRVHPKRYVSFSVFGRKSKANYLTAPLIDDTMMLVSPAVYDTLKLQQP